MMTVAYSTDERYVKLTAVSMASLLKNNTDVKVLVLVNGVKIESVSFLRELCERMGGVFESVDVTARLKEFERRRANGYTSYSIYARFYIPELVGSGRCLYLDSDTLVVGSIAPLFDHDMGGRPFAIGYECQRIEYKKLVGIEVSLPYFNSGVMLLDVPKWRFGRCTERIMSAIPGASPRSMFPDQDLIVRVLHDEAAVLPPQYNFLTHFQLFRTQEDVLRVTGVPPKIWYSPDAYAKARQCPVIHHFLGHTLGRPWYRESRNPLRPLYREYARLAGVPEVAEQSRPLDFCYRVQHWCWRLLPNWAFVQACRAMYRYFFRSHYGV